MKPERLSGFYKKEKMRTAAIMAAFSLFGELSDKSQGLGQSPKVLIESPQCFNLRMSLQKSVEVTVNHRRICHV